MSKELVSITHLNINSFDTSSGVFIGNNRAHHWHSTTKSNQGFGQVNASQNHHIINAVFDNDAIDMVNYEQNQVLHNQSSYVDDHEHHAHQEHDNFIKFNQINANTLHSNASISVGENQQNLWHTNTKNNFGNGQFSGKTYMNGIRNTISDNDVIDVTHQNDFLKAYRHPTSQDENVETENSFDNQNDQTKSANARGVQEES